MNVFEAESGRSGGGGVIEDVMFFVFKQKTAYEMMRRLVGSER